MTQISGPETDAAGSFEQLGERVQEAMARLKVPGVAVGVWHRGQEYSAGYGVTNVEYPSPVDADTLFQIGSISKTFTGTLVMKLVEMGKLELDEPIRAYLPNLRLADENVASRVTLRHLLTHTGGWPGDYFEDTGFGDDGLAKYVANMVELPQITPLGSLWHYNNAGFNLAGLVVEAVTGQTFEAVMQELIFEPLGLKQAVYFANDAILYRVAAGHIVREDKPTVARPWPLTRSAHAAGGISASVKDLLKYARFHLSGGKSDEGKPVLSPESVALMQTPQVPMNLDGEMMGLTWFLIDVGGQMTVNHGGATNGFMAYLRLVPEQDFAIAVLTNSNQGAVLYLEIVRWAQEHYLGLSNPEAEPLEMSREQLEGYVGKYQFRLNDVEIKLGEEGLVLQAYPKGGFPAKDSPAPPTPPPTRLVFYAEDRVKALDFPYKDARAEFLRNPDGSIQWLRFSSRIGPRVG